MIFKNGFKEYFTSGLIYGSCMGLFVGLATSNLLLGLVMGAFAGVLFGVFIFIFSRSIEKKFIAKRSEISTARRIICDGAATYNGQGGWLFFTDSALEFYPHKINASTKYLILPNEKLKSTCIYKNRMEISAFDDKKFVFIVTKNKEWKKQIDGYFEYIDKISKEGSV